MLVVGVAYLGACIYANFIQREPGEYRVPSVTKAQYEITIHNTGKVLYADSYEYVGSEFILQGYWELIKSNFIFRDRQITLDESIFGEITVRSR